MRCKRCKEAMPKGQLLDYGEGVFYCLTCTKAIHREIVHHYAGRCAWCELPLQDGDKVVDGMGLLYHPQCMCECFVEECGETLDAEAKAEIKERTFTFVTPETAMVRELEEQIQVLEEEYGEGIRDAITISPPVKVH